MGISQDKYEKVLNNIHNIVYLKKIKKIIIQINLKGKGAFLCLQMQFLNALLNELRKSKRIVSNGNSVGN